MDMKKILQTLDNVSAPAQQSVQEKTDMEKFISIIEKNDVKILNEGSNPHKVALPVQMAMQHYQKEDNKKDSLLRKYFKEAEESALEKTTARKALLSQYAQNISKKVLNRSRAFENADLAQSYISQLTAMMQQATEPWQKKQLEYRIKAVQQGMVPQNKKILPPIEWERTTSPTIIARIIDKDGLSPEYLEKTNMFGRGLDYIGLPGRHPTNPDLKFESGK